MTEKETIIKAFISNFVVREKRERSSLELTTPEQRGAFINRFNHSWETVINRNYLNKVEKSLDYPATIGELPGFGDNQLCYVISHYEETDDRIVGFGDVFEVIYGRGLASIVMNLSDTIFYLETEQIHRTT
jgi:hypothetical protein